MHIDIVRKIKESKFINRGINDYKNKRVKDGKSAIKEIRDKYGI